MAWLLREQMACVVGSVKRYAQGPSVSGPGAPPDFSVEPSFSPLEGDTSASNLPGVTLGHAAASSFLFDSYGHFKSPFSDNCLEQAHRVGTLSILGRWR